MKLRELPDNALFSLFGTTYRKLHFADSLREKFFVLENVSTSHVFESDISPDMEVTPI